MPKILYVFIFAACHKHPFSRSFANTHFLDHLVSWGWASHVMNIYKCNTKSYLRRCILLSKIVCFSSIVFSPAFIFLFGSSQVFWYMLVFTPTDVTLKQKWCVEKDETSEAVYFLKVSNKDTIGITESCSKWKYMTLFLCPYW